MDRMTSQGLAVIGETGGDPAAVLGAGVPTADSVDAVFARLARAVVESEAAKAAAAEMLSAYGDVSKIVQYRDQALAAAQQAIINVASQAEDLNIEAAVANVVTNALDAQAKATAVTPTGDPGVGRLPMRDDDNVLRWTAASAVVARALGWKIAADYGADSTGAADSTEALNNCAAAAAAAGTTWYASGVFKTSGTVISPGPCQLQNATLNYTATGAGVAFQLGTDAAGVRIDRAEARLPLVINMKKAGVGWAQVGVAGSVGVKVINANTCEITVPYVAGFETGLLMYGRGQGTTYCTVHLGHLSNNKINQLMDADATGWANQNTFLGGRLSHSSAEGNAVAGVRHIKFPVTASKVNNNLWINVSLEGDIPEYHVECGGVINEWHACRWENGTSGCRFHVLAGASQNQVIGGYAAHQIVQTFATDALPQNIISAARWDLGVALPGNAVASTAYACRVSTEGVRIKPLTGANDRFFIEASTGRMYMGNGGAAPTMYLGALGTTGVVLAGGHFYSGTDATYDIGLTASQRFRDLHLARNAVVGGTLAAKGKLTASADVDVAGTLAAKAALTVAGNATLSAALQTDSLRVMGMVGFYGKSPIDKPVVTGDRSTTAALTSLLNALEALGLVTDGSTA